jgi:hypothetical protein
MEQPSNFTMETAAPDIQAENGADQPKEVSASDFFTPNTTAEQKPQGAKGAQQPQQTRNGGAQAVQEPEIKTQPDFNRALNARLTQERTKLENRYKSSAQYSVGDFLLREYMEQNGVSEEEAARRILNERADRKAEEAAKDPKKFYRDMYAQQGAAQRPQAQPQAKQYQPQGNDLASELQSAVSTGNIPQGFLPEHIDQFFVNDAQAFGLQYAFDRWEQSNGAQPQYQPQQQRYQQPTQQAQPQRQQPATKPMRVQGTDATVKPLDFSTESMDSKTFKENYEKLRKAAQNGDRVVFR